MAASLFISLMINIQEFGAWSNIKFINEMEYFTRDYAIMSTFLVTVKGNILEKEDLMEVSKKYEFTFAFWCQIWGTKFYHWKHLIFPGG